MPHNFSDWWSIGVFTAIVVSWFAFALIFVTRRSPATASEQKRDPSSITGIVIQGLSYAIIWALHRCYFSPFIAGNQSLNITFGVIAISLAFCSVVFTASAVQTLGKEWSLTARVVEGHELAVSGAYAWVRHPIYTGMLGMLIATGIATSYWPVLIVAVIVLVIGTTIRIRKEERLLQELFGKDFDAYSRRVSAIVPWVY